MARLDGDHFLVATDKGLNLSDGGRGWFSFTGSEGLPILDLTQVAAGADGSVWLGSEQGLMRWKDGGWTYLAGKRWLPDNRVLAIAPAADGAVWVGTPKGLAHIFYRKLTLAEKSAILQRNLESRDRRFGYVTVMQDCRGRFESEGEYDTIFQEIADGYDAVEWSARQSRLSSSRYLVAFLVALRARPIVFSALPLISSPAQRSRCST